MLKENWKYWGNQRSQRNEICPGTFIIAFFEYSSWKYHLSINIGFHLFSNRKMSFLLITYIFFCRCVKFGVTSGLFLIFILCKIADLFRNKECYLHSDSSLHLCYYYYIISVALPSGLQQALVDPGNLYGISKWSLYLIYVDRVF